MHLFTKTYRINQIISIPSLFFDFRTCCRITVKSRQLVPRTLVVRSGGNIALAKRNLDLQCTVRALFNVPANKQHRTGDQFSKEARISIFPLLLHCGVHLPVKLSANGSFSENSFHSFSHLPLQDGQTRHRYYLC